LTVRNTARRFLGIRYWLLVLCACAGAAAAGSQEAPVTGKIELVAGKAEKAAPASHGSVPDASKDASNVAVWLTRIDENGNPLAPETTPAGPSPQLVQRNKSFEPHVLVVEVGSLIQFPNKDPFFHNVFSLYDGKRFDLGLYEAGTTRSVRFSRPGVSFLFCNIHPEMSAVVVAVDTPYFGVSDRAGRVSIANVPDGRYEMHVWYERSLADSLKTLDRAVAISASARSLGTIQVTDSNDFKLTHKNKYGQDYIPSGNITY
jgi:plastocyanin